MTEDEMEWFSEKFKEWEWSSEKFKELLREAEDKGYDVEEFCMMAENILGYGWRKEQSK